MTNLLHLAELLQVAGRTHPGMVGLLKWLGDRRRVPTNRDEEQQLRLESDENLVRIVTVHKSKGLEYDVVLPVPVGWPSARRRENDTALLYHDPADAGPPSSPSARMKSTRPTTRPPRGTGREPTTVLRRPDPRQTTLHAGLGQDQEAETAPPAWLLHRRRSSDHPRTR